MRRQRSTPQPPRASIDYNRRGGSRDRARGLSLGWRRNVAHAALVRSAGARHFAFASAWSTSTQPRCPAHGCRQRHRRLVVALALGSALLPRLLFLPPLAQPQAGVGNSGTQSALFQGFVFPWTRDLSGGGYTTPSSAQNLRNEAHTFHMNSVIIQVFADMPHRDTSQLEWQAAAVDDIHTLPDPDYIQAIKGALAAGLIPILELEARQQDTALSGTDQSAYWVGKGWFDRNFNVGFTPYSGANLISVGPTEHAFFDVYTAFAVHYAQLSAQYHLPYFIIGDGLSSITYDTANTAKSADNQETSGGPSGCTGRRDCEWRHVIAAIHGANYTPLQAVKRNRAARTAAS